SGRACCNRRISAISSATSRPCRSMSASTRFSSARPGTAAMSRRSSKPSSRCDVFMPTIRADRLEALVGDIFNAAGCSRAEADRIARYLVAANLAGHDSHGVVRVPRYVEMKQDGRVIADQRVEILVDTPVLTVIDGKFGFGQTIAPQAVAIGIEKCEAMGLSAVALRNAGHIGRVGDWAEMAAAKGVIS